MDSTNIEISGKEVLFGENLSCSLVITNKHSNKSLFFKIKTTQLNTYDVKPPIGIVLPQQKKTIDFKVIAKMVKDV